MIIPWPHLYPHSIYVDETKEGDPVRRGRYVLLKNASPEQIEEYCARFREEMFRRAKVPE